MKFTPSKLLDLLYPRRCALCDGILKKDEPLICRECARILTFRTGTCCVKCGRPLTGRPVKSRGALFGDLTEELPEEENETKLPGVCGECEERALPHDECVAPFDYCGAVRDSLIRFKYHDRAEYAGFFAAAILHYAGKRLRRWRPDALVAVPVHKSRLAKRGYNQAYLIAKELSARTGIPLRNGLISREKKTEAQKELSFEERRRNIKDAFVYTGAGRAPKTIVVVDDIFTTGSTLGTIAGLLKEHGAEKVYGICVSS